MKAVQRRRFPAPALREQIARLIELRAAHARALAGDPDAQTFYDDGRHHELLRLQPIVHGALGIKPWHDDVDERLRAALDETA